jgi:hypothetical protein
MENFLVTSVQDTTLDLTDDNRQVNIGIPETNAGDIPANVHDRNDSSHVSGHVLFNVAGKCLNRKRGAITGNSRQKFWVQNLCSTSPGESAPLLQPEASLCPRHFYASASKDNRSILGAC